MRHRDGGKSKKVEGCSLTVKFGCDYEKWMSPELVGRSQELTSSSSYGGCSNGGMGL